MNQIDPYGLEILTLPGYGGVQSTTPLDLGFKERPPEYFAFSANLGIAQIVIERDRFGNFYISPINFGGSFGGGGLSFWGMSLVGGWLDRCDEVKEEDLRNFLTGPSTNFNIAYGLSTGLTFVEGQGRALEFGFSLPGIGMGTPNSRGGKPPYLQ